MFEVDSHHVAVIGDVLVCFSHCLPLLFSLSGFPPCAPVVFVFFLLNEFLDLEYCLVDRVKGWALFVSRDLVDFQWHGPLMVWVHRTSLRVGKA